MAVVVLSLGACTSSTPEPDSTSTHTSRPSPSGSATDDLPEGTVTREVQHLGDDLTIDVHPVQVSGVSALVTIDVALSKSATTDVIWFDSLWGNALGQGLEGIRLVDLGAGQLWLAATDADDQALTTSDKLSVKPGTTLTMQVVFGAPGDSSNVDVLLPYFGFVEDVPVVQVSDIGGDLAELGVGADTVYPSAPLEAFTVAYDNLSRAAVEGDAATIALSSDVLFATDEFALTDAAAQVVDSAAVQIKGASAGGEVQVVGHTDDVGSEEYNQDLSVKRAESVAARLAPALGASFTVRTEGRGESEPAIDGTSDEARAANRRVEIGFTAQQPGQALEVATGAVAPEPTGVVGTASAPVTATAATGDQYSVSATSVIRRDGYLIGTLAVTRVAGKEDGTVQALLANADRGPETALNFSALDRVSGAIGVTLLGQDSRYFPSVYEIPSDEKIRSHTVLADRGIDHTKSGTPSLVTVVWPDTGQDKVTIDVQGRFRITDVPVEKG
ncbi:OmpA family protein [Cellulomonas sp. URHB0016]